MARESLIQVRQDTAAEWNDVNPTLASGEIGFETDTGKFKIGALRTYAIGDVGPGGGKIFITPSTAGNSTGKYFEVAPVGAEVTRTWATGGNQSLAVTGAGGTAIGTGAQNTIDIVAQSGNVAATSAAVYCSELVYGGKSDWFLPSTSELLEMYVNRVALNTGFATDIRYWSSTQYNAGSAFRQDLTAGVVSFNAKNSAGYYVRPVRAFTVGMEWEHILYATDASDITGATLASNVVSSSLTSFGSSPVLAGTPTAPTATAGTNTTQIATMASRPWNVPWGVVSYTSSTSSDTSLADEVEEVQLTGASFTAVSGRLYKVTYFEPGIFTNGGSGPVTARIRLTNISGTVLNECYEEFEVYYRTRFINLVFVGTIAAGTRNVVATLYYSGNTAYIGRGSERKAFLFVEDIGPA